MTLTEFMNALETHHAKALMLEYSPGLVVPAGYHVTEIIKAIYESVDCGGQANQWQNSVVQLMGPKIKDKREYMKVKKFLDIVTKVSGNMNLTETAELRIEYGNSQTPAMQYHVLGLEILNDSVLVQLSPPGVTCKASDRKIDGLACCAPAPVKQAISNLVWQDANPKRSGGCC